MNEFRAAKLFVFHQIQKYHSSYFIKPQFDLSLMFCGKIFILNTDTNSSKSYDQKRNPKPHRTRQTGQSPQ